MEQKIHDQIRQGDVLLLPIVEPSNIDLGSPEESERAILAYGESTGHHHVLCGRARYFRPPGTERRLIEVLGTGAVLRHEDQAGGQADHAPVPLAPRWYEQRVQHEYEPAAPFAPSRRRRVRD